METVNLDQLSTGIGIFQSATKLRKATVHYLIENNLIHRMLFELLANVSWEQYV